jgi:hypothetical protein
MLRYKHYFFVSFIILCCINLWGHAEFVGMLIGRWKNLDELVFCTLIGHKLKKHPEINTKIIWQLINAQMVKKISHFYRTQRFITKTTTGPYPELLQDTLSHSYVCKINFNILPSMIRSSKWSLYLFMVYLTMLSVTQTVQHQMIWWLMNDKLQRIWKEAVKPVKCYIFTSFSNILWWIFSVI